jgi:hypothetical protein
MVFGKGKKSKLQTAIAVLSGEEPPVPEAMMTTTEEPRVATAKPSSEEKAAARAAAKVERDAKKNAAIESKYAHVVPGSVRSVPRGEVVDGVASKGKMCTVACVDCGAHRQVNVQDAFQAKRCRGCYQNHLKDRQRTRRQEVQAKPQDPAPEAALTADSPASNT